MTKARIQHDLYHDQTYLNMWYCKKNGLATEKAYFNMPRLFASLVFVIGLICVTLAAALLNPVVTVAQEDDLEYVGAKECSSCHRDVVRSHSSTPHTLTLQDVARDKDPILADFSQGEAVRTVTFPDDDTARPFTEDDVAYVVGTGRNVQRYLYEAARNEYLVFPAEWNVAEQQWQPFQLADTWSAEAYDWETNCAYCHTTGFDAERGRWEDDGVLCETCHGPGSLHAELADDAGRRPSAEELTELRAAIAVGVDPQTCGQCHSRGTTLYPQGYLPGTTLFMEGVFLPVALDDPVHWWNSGHAKQANMQFNEWFGSTHALTIDPLKEAENVQPACLTCHSADFAYTEQLRTQVEQGERDGAMPDALTIETVQWGVTCTTCHSVHSENTPETPTAYIISEPYQLCSGCHSDPDPSDGVHHAMLQMYEGVTLIEGIEGIPSAHFTAEDGPDCVTCHMPDVPVTEGGTRRSHTFAPVLPGDATSELPDSCSNCHSDEVNATQMQQLIDDIQSATQSRIERARTAIQASSPAWLTLALDLVEGDGSWGVHNYAYTDALLDAVELELGLVDASPAGEGEQS
jgi:predicted CXXCH cytochrome family protein